MSTSSDFDFLHGRWLVAHRYLTRRLVDDDDWQDISGAADCRPLLAGSANVDEITIEGRGVVGATLRLFDREAGQWTIYWANRATGRLDPPMIGRFANGVGTFFGDDDHDGRPITLRFIWDNISPATARWQQAFSTDAGTTWETNWVMGFSRVEPPPR